MPDWRFGDRKKTIVMFREDDPVCVVSGPFTHFSGVVEEVDEARSRLKVALSVFGRVTRVELEYGQVEKA